ncbi:MAG: hypothetical protein ACRD5W_15850, partial [Candidatus Acidiferrales bacterium]
MGRSTNRNRRNRTRKQKIVKKLQQQIKQKKKLRPAPGHFRGQVSAFVEHLRLSVRRTPDV